MKRLTFIMLLCLFLPAMTTGQGKGGDTGLSFSDDESLRATVLSAKGAGGKIILTMTYENLADEDHRMALYSTDAEGRNTILVDSNGEQWEMETHDAGGKLLLSGVPAKVTITFSNKTGAANPETVTLVNYVQVLAEAGRTANPRWVKVRINSIPGAFTQESGAPAAPSKETFRVEVLARSRWLDTGVHLAQGDSFEILASGRVATTSESRALNGPDGQPYACNGDCTFPSGSFGQLIGRIGGEAAIFRVGSRAVMLSPRDGTLFLAVNDCCDWNDNVGSFNVLITVERAQ